MYKHKLFLAFLLITGILLMTCGTALAEVIQYDGYSLEYSLNNSAYTAEVTGINNISKSGLNVAIPENITVNGTVYNVTSIGYDAFEYCSNLSSISCPNVTSIGGSAFSHCSNLSSVSFPNVTSIGDWAFSYCSNLRSVSFPNVTSIGDYAFYYCFNLSSVSFPDVTSIGGSAFENCSNFASVFIGSKAEEIMYIAFKNCSNLTAVYFKGSTLPEYTNSSYSHSFLNVSPDIVFYRSSEYTGFDWRDLNGTKGVFNPAYITYNANGGSGKMEKGKYVSGVESVYVYGCGFTGPKGKDFLGWNTKADGSGKSYLLGESFIPSENMTLYAVWGKCAPSDPTEEELKRVETMIDSFVNGNELDSSYDYHKDGIIDGRDLIEYQRQIYGRK